MSCKEKEKGILALFTDPHDLLTAVKKVRVKLGVKKMEAFSPFPVHGMEQAMGLKRSWLPRVTLFMGLLGAALGFYFQYWTMAVSWPVNVGGKPFFAWPAYIPITFELFVLIGGVTTTLVFYGVICGLPRFDKPVLDLRLTDDLFGLFIQTTDENYNETSVNEIFKECHAQEIKNIA